MNRERARHAVVIGVGVLALALIGGYVIHVLTWSFTPLATQPHAIAAAPLDDGSVLLLAQPRPGDDLVASRIDTWAQPVDGGTVMVGAGFVPTMTKLDDGRVLVVGGETPCFTAWIYQPGSGSFERASAPEDRCFRMHTATLLTTGEVLVAGGLETEDFAQGASREARLYDPREDRWTDLPPMTDARAGHSAIRLLDGAVLLVGGINPGTAILSSAERFDPVARTFTPTGTMQLPRYAHGAARLADGRVIIIGGGESLGTAQQPHASTELYDPATGVWTEGPELETPRSGFATLSLEDGRVLVIGGWSRATRQGLTYYAHRVVERVTGTSDGLLDSTELLDADGDAWRRGPTLKHPRYDPVGVVTQAGVVLIVGERIDPEALYGERWEP